MSRRGTKTQPRLLGQVVQAVIDLREVKGSSARHILDQVRTSIATSLIHPKPRNVPMQVRRALKHGIQCGLLLMRNGKYRLLLNPDNTKKINSFNPNSNTAALSFRCEDAQIKKQLCGTCGGHKKRRRRSRKRRSRHGRSRRRKRCSRRRRHRVGRRRRQNSLDNESTERQKSVKFDDEEDQIPVKKKRCPTPFRSCQQSPPEDSVNNVVRDREQTVKEIRDRRSVSRSRHYSNMERGNYRQDERKTINPRKRSRSRPPNMNK